VEYDGEQINIDSGDEITDNNGEFTLYIIIPESELGNHTITIRGQDSFAEIDLNFTVVPPPPTTTVTVTITREHTTTIPPTFTTITTTTEHTITPPPTTTTETVLAY
jgi:hypothetical protein